MTEKWVTFYITLNPEVKTDDQGLAESSLLASLSVIPGLWADVSEGESEALLESVQTPPPGKQASLKQYWLWLSQSSLQRASVLSKIDLKWLLKAKPYKRDEVMFSVFEPEHDHSALKGLVGLMKPWETEVTVLIKGESIFIHCFYSHQLI